MRIVLVGAGTMGHVHGDAYQKMPQHQVTAVVDPDSDRGQALARRLQAPWLPSVSAALDSVDADVVDVSAPSFRHRELVETAAQAGKHVVCEKPLALSLEDARSMRAACHAASVHLFVGHVVRFFPEYERAHQLIAQGALGDVGTVRLFRGGGFPHGHENWYADPGLSGGVPLDLMIHDVDFLHWCFGPVARIYAKAAHTERPTRADHVLASLRFANGVVAHVEGSWAYPRGFRTAMDIAGPQGLLTHDSEALPSLRLNQRMPATGHPVEIPDSLYAQSPYYRELAHFLDCLETGETPRVTVDDAIRALETCCMVAESLHTGRPIVAAPVEGGNGRG